MKIIKYVLLYMVKLFSLSISICSLFLFSTANSYDYNKTLLHVCSTSLTNNSQRFLVELNNPNYSKINWYRFFSIYNYDFYNNSFSTGFRISKNEVTINDTGSNSFCTKLSSIWQCNHTNNENHNMSSLFIDFSMTNFKKDSAIVEKLFAVSHGLSIGDAIYIKESDSSLKTLSIVALYEETNSNQEMYLNNEYIKTFNSPIFVSNDYFEEMIGDFDSFVSFGRDYKMIMSCYKELSAICAFKKTRMEIVKNSLLNQKYIDNNTLFYDFSINLYKLTNNLNSNTKSSIGLVFLIVSLLIVLAYENFFVKEIVRSNNSNKRKNVLLLISIVSSLLLSLCAVIFNTYFFVEKVFSIQKIFVNSALFLRMLSIITISCCAYSILSYLFYSYFYSEVHRLQNKKNTSSFYSKHDSCEDIESNVIFENDNAIINSKDTILMLGSFSYPITSAGGKRVISFAKELKAHGKNVFIGCLSKNVVPKIIEENIVVYPYYTVPKNIFEKTIAYFFPIFKIQQLLLHLKKYNISALYIYSVFPISSLPLLLKYCKKNNIKIIFDVVEWFDIRYCSITNFFSEFLQNRIINKCIIDKACTTITISSFLNNYFASKKIKSNLIPFVSHNVDCNANISLMPDKKIRILYAGNPSRGKDLLKPIIKALQQLNEDEREKIEIVIAGPSIEDLILKEKISLNSIKSVENSLVLLERVNQHTIEQLYSTSDFSILIRDEKSVSSKAGFPTKISESLSYGVPPLTNLTSDLKLYLNDENSLIVESSSYENIAKSLRKAIALNRSEVDFLKKNALSTFHQKLSVDNYSELINSIFDKGE